MKIIRAIALSILSALALGCSPAPAVTMREFDTLTEGDTLAKVQEKIGDPGTKISETGQFQIWQFSNKDGSNAVVTIGSNGMMLKAQAGLK
jgi:hypothetical protein